MSYRPDLRVPYRYETSTITLFSLRLRMLAEDQDPEYVERFIAWLDWCGGLVGYGGGTRDVQPDKPGFAPDGQSFHLRQLYGDGRRHSSAVDVVRLNPNGGDHLTVRWTDVPKQGTQEARTWGVHANVDQGTNPEAWHIQPIERDGWQSWVNVGRPGLRANYPFPGRNVTPTPPPPPPPPIPVPTDTPRRGRTMKAVVLRYGGTPDGGWAGYYSLDLVTRLPVTSMHGANLLMTLGAVDAKTGQAVTNWGQVTHTTNAEELDEWLTPNRD